MHKQMKNILLPTDFSENSWNAIQYAVQLYKKETCTFHLLNTYTPLITNSRFMASTIGTDNFEDGIREASEQGLREMLGRIQEIRTNSAHSFKTISSFSLLVDEIKEIIEDERIDMVIIGTKGASGMDQIFMGSNTVRIIKAVKNCPVLAIPQHFEFEKLSEIAFATDFTRFYTLAELKPLIDLANAFAATIRIVCVQQEIKALSELQRFNLGMLRKYLEGVEHYVHTISELNSISKSLEVFADELDIHLLAMLNHQHSYMEKITREPVIKRLAFHTQIPLLVIPEFGISAPTKGRKDKKMSISK